jgi:GNAT superfamily N-acetyltransferase
MRVARVDENLFEFYAFASAAAGKPCVREDGFSYLRLQPSPWANTVYALDFPAGRGLPASLAEGVRRGRLPNQVRAGPSSRPADIEARLREAGFALDSEARGMILDMGRRRRFPAPEGLSIRRLEGEGDFLVCSRLVATELFKSGGESVPPFAELLGSLAPDRAFGFLGSLRGEPASTAFAFIDGEGGAGLYFVATAAPLRARGFAKAVIGAVLDELEQRACPSCILQATELGKPAYESLGFEDACALSRYRLPLES